MSRAAAGSRSGTSIATAPDLKLIRPIKGYLQESELPITSLVFLLPMIILYELGTHYFTSDWASRTETRVLAFNLMRRFLELFGATGRYLPAAAVVGILLTWHIARADPWRVRGTTTLLMTAESALLALPVITLGGIVNYYVPLYGGARGWQSGVVLSLGAGVYEELVFRLISFTLLNILLVDILRCGKNPAHLLIVVGSAVLFALYHYWSPQSAPFRLSDFTFRAVAGVYFGLLFVTRGFGITAGTHAAYDIYFFLLRG